MMECGYGTTEAAPEAHLFSRWTLAMGQQVMAFCGKDFTRPAFVAAGTCNKPFCAECARIAAKIGGLKYK